ncbi:MAG: M48 family metalloprotease [Alphaproteobacteria bacterium]|nr:M48 family metalloprotease [Alphaproteobacteria bacterium]MDX5415541.1 M48 family metalloprotease [Alphaproteobacteria bacterium]MDX5492779.1 M48 family metalloprotease [Alphaproteobacteria bacterium]
MVFSRSGKGFRAGFQAIALVTALTLCALLPVTAQAQGIRIVSDAETEAMLREYSDPLLRAAGIDPAAVKIHLVNDRNLNAFVAGGQQMFFHTGLITTVNSPGELMGVIAHEIGHMSGGHLVKRREEFENLSMPVMASMILGVGAIAAGAGDAGMALIMGSQHLATRSLLAFTREQEASADQAGATFLQRAGLSGKGMLDLFASMRDQELLSESRQDPYARSHPMSGARYAALEARVKESPYFDKPDPPERIHSFKMIQAKIYGFLDDPNVVFRRYPASDTSPYAHYARSVAYHRTGQLDRALADPAPLLKQEPNTPYVWEVQGQIYFESGQVEEAIASYSEAVRLKPEDNQLHLGLGRALAARGDAETTKQAISHLNTAARRGDQPYAYYQLSIAYGQLGNIGMAELSTAQYYDTLGRVQQAKAHAGRAMRQLAQGSPEWLRAQDIALQPDQERRG